MLAGNMVATHELRFVKRKGPMRPGTSDSNVNAVMHFRILQQRWVVVGTMWGTLDETNSEWRDVPEVEE